MIVRRTADPSFHFRNAYDTPANSGCRFRSSAVTGRGASTVVHGSGRTNSRKVKAPVGQDTMHSPHDTQLDWPIGSFRSKPMWAV